MTPTPRQLLARIAAEGVTVWTAGGELRLSRAVPDDLLALIRANFDGLHALLVAREDAEAADLIPKAAAKFGWGRDDCEIARRSVCNDAHRALSWLRWVVSDGDARAYLPKQRSDAVRAARQRARKATSP